MRLFLLATILLLPFGLFAKGLPSDPGMKSVALPTVQTGRKVRISFSAMLPGSQKLNPVAPSHFAVYERIWNDWIEVKNVKLAHRLAFGDVIEVNEEVDLKNDASEIAVHSTLYHCGKDNKTACYIQAFQGQTKRAASGASQVRFVAKATVEKFER